MREFTIIFGLKCVATPSEFIFDTNIAHRLTNSILVDNILYYNIIFIKTYFLTIGTTKFMLLYMLCILDMTTTFP